MREITDLFRYLESIAVFVEVEIAASGFFAETAFFNDVFCAEVCPGAYLVFKDRYAGAFLILADNRCDLTVCAPEASEFNV